MDFKFPQQDKLMSLAEASKEKYQSGSPFPHIVFDNFFDVDLLGKVLEEFPGPKDIKWRKFNNSYEDKKLASRGENQFGDVTKSFGHFLNSSSFLSFLEELTGISGLISDPFFDGGGLHQIIPGGLLKVHADFNKDSRTNLDRRLNVLVYLNENWKEEYGGYFELWDQAMQKPEVKVLPIFNRVAIFSTTDTSYHGHPDPLMCPEDRTRKSFATYYYSNGRPADESHTVMPTTFQARPGEENLKAIEEARWQRKQAKRKAMRVLKSFIPPILYGRIIE